MKIIHFLKSNLKIILFALAFIVLLTLDIISKNLAFNLLEEGHAVTAIPYLFNFTLVFNTGAAWGMMAGQKWLLCVISAVLGTAILVFFIMKFKKLKVPVLIALILMVAGAYGNLIDRIGQAASLGIYSRGVIDFIQFAFWPSFPVFNLADSYLVIGIFVLIIYYLVIFIKEQLNKKNQPIDETIENDETDLAKKIAEKNNEQHE